MADNTSTFDLKLQSDAEIQGFTAYGAELQKVIAATKAAGGDTAELDQELRSIQATLGTKVQTAYSDYLNELITKEKEAGRETAELERRLKTLSAAQSGPKPSTVAGPVGFEQQLKLDPQIAGLQRFERELKQVAAAERLAGKDTAALDAEVRKVQAALGSRVGQVFAQYLRDLIATERSAGRETADLERRLHALGSLKVPQPKLQAQAVLGGTGVMGEFLGKASAVASELPGISSLLGTVTVGTVGWAAALVGLTAGLSSVAKDGIAFNSQLEDAQLGIAAVLKQFDTVGKFSNFDDAMEASADAIELLKQKAVESPASFGELVSAFQATTGAATAANIPLKQQVDLVLLMSQTLAGLGIRSEQIIQESRALLTGNITEDAAAARILGITKQQIDAAKEQGRLYEFLKERMSGFSEAGVRGMGNLSTMTSNLGDAWTQLKGNLTKPLFDSQIIQGAIGKLTEIIGHFAKITSSSRDLKEELQGTATVAKQIKLDDLLESLDTAIKKTRELRQQQEELKDAESAVKLAQLDVDEQDALAGASTDAEKDAIKLDFKRKRQAVRSQRDVEKAQSGVDQAQSELDATKAKQTERDKAEADRVAKSTGFQNKAFEAGGVLQRGKNLLPETAHLDYSTPEGIKKLQEVYERVYQEGTATLQQGGSGALTGYQRKQFEMAKEVLDAIPKYQQNMQASNSLVLSTEDQQKKQEADKALADQAAAQERQLKIAQSKLQVAEKTNQAEQKGLQQESADADKQKKRRDIEEQNRIDEAKIKLLQADPNQHQEAAITELQNRILQRNQQLPGRTKGENAVDQAQIDVNNLNRDETLRKRNAEAAKEKLKGLSNADDSLNLQYDPRQFGETNAQRDKRNKDQITARAKLDSAFKALGEDAGTANVQEAVTALDEAAKVFPKQGEAIKALQNVVKSLADQLKAGAAPANFQAPQVGPNPVAQAPTAPAPVPAKTTGEAAPAAEQVPAPQPTPVVPAPTPSLPAVVPPPVPAVAPVIPVQPPVVPVQPEAPQPEIQSTGQGENRQRLDKAMKDLAEAADGSALQDAIAAVEGAAKALQGQNAAIKALTSKVDTLASQVKAAR